MVSTFCVRIPTESSLAAEQDYVQLEQRDHSPKPLLIKDTHERPNYRRKKAPLFPLSQHPPPPASHHWARMESSSSVPFPSSSLQKSASITANDYCIVNGLLTNFVLTLYKSTSMYNYCSERNRNNKLTNETGSNRTLPHAQGGWSTWKMLRKSCQWPNSTLRNNKQKGHYM